MKKPEKNRSSDLICNKAQIPSGICFRVFFFFPLCWTSGCFVHRAFLVQMQRVLWPTLRDNGGSLGPLREVNVCAQCTLFFLGLLMLAWPSGFQRPYSVERGAQRTLDYYRGVFLITVVYVVPIVSSWGLRSCPGMGGTRSRADLICARRRSHYSSSYFFVIATIRPQSKFTVTQPSCCSHLN